MNIVDSCQQEQLELGQLDGRYCFICTECRSVIEFDNLLVNTIKAHFELHSGAQVETGHVVLSGLCAHCREQRAIGSEQPKI